MLTSEEIYEYITDLVKAKFITKEKALTYANTFHDKGKISDEQYKDLMLLIESTYED